MCIKSWIGGAVLAALTGAPVAAQDVALAIGVADYVNLPDVAGGAEVTSAIRELEDIGFETYVSSAVDPGPQIEVLRDFARAADGAERIVVALSGQFMTDGQSTWLLQADADRPVIFDMPRNAVDLGSVLAVLARAPGDAVLLLGTGRDDGDLGTFAELGIGPLDVPQGVTVVIGDARDTAGLIGDVLAAPGAALNGALNAGDFDVLGYLPRRFVLVEAELFGPQPAPEPAAEPDPEPEQDGDPAEAAAWARASQINSIEAYEVYLAAYPAGEHAEAAEAAIEAIRSEPERDARLAEEALELDREARREIQADLVILDYDTRGIDGIFGPGTRGAIGNWQSNNGYEETQFLTPDQIAAIASAADLRREQILAEDRAYWQETGAGGDHDGLEAYLERYPDGEFAEEARAGLERFRAEEREAQGAQDREAWSAAESADTAEAYRGYLDRFPEGQFAAIARQRIEEAASASNRTAQLEQQEALLGLNPLTRQLIEQLLAQLGLDPGAIDGQFDARARNAIGQYQAARGTASTGYIDQQTIAIMLSEGLRLR